MNVARPVNRDCTILPAHASRLVILGVVKHYMGRPSLTCVGAPRYELVVCNWPSVKVCGNNVARCCRIDGDMGLCLIEVPLAEVHLLPKVEDRTRTERPINRQQKARLEGLEERASFSPV